jgi:hypothetical protein
VRLEQEIIKSISPPAISIFFQTIDLGKVCHLQAPFPFGSNCSLLRVSKSSKPALCFLELSNCAILKFAPQADSAFDLRGCMGRSLVISEVGSRDFVPRQAMKASAILKLVCSCAVH